MSKKKKKKKKKKEIIVVEFPSWNQKTKIWKKREIYIKKYKKKKIDVNNTKWVNTFMREGKRGEKTLKK